MGRLTTYMPVVVERGIISLESEKLDHLCPKCGSIYCEDPALPHNGQHFFWCQDIRIFANTSFNHFGFYFSMFKQGDTLVMD